MFSALMTSLALVGCSGGDEGQGRFHLFSRRPETKPEILNKTLPFQYPIALYPQKAQGNVVLRLYVNREGQVVNESTRVAKGSGYAEFDTAAIRGAKELLFVPAKRRGEPVGTSILVPVFFRHPDGPPLPEDSLVKKGSNGL